MIVTYSRKTLFVVKNVSDLENFILENSIYKHFKKFHKEFYKELKEEIDRTESLSFKKFKPWLKNILKYPESIYNQKFLFSMGWEENEINMFICKQQKKNASVVSKNKSLYPERYIDKTNTRIEYWLKKGYNLSESQVHLKNRQSTFSLDKCIEKYGKEEGLKVFNIRQNKWITSLANKENYNEIQKTKNSYKNKTVLEKINQSSFTENTKEIILKNLTGRSLSEFVEKVSKEIDIKRYSDIQPFFNSKTIQEHFNVSNIEIKKSFYDKIFYNLKRQTYGVPVYHNGIRFKSIKEYMIALFLEDNQVEYIYEKNYPNSNLKFDFYLPKYDVFIEYFGMLDGKNQDKLNELQKEYKNKVQLKNLYCENNNLSLVQDVNYDALINKLKKII